MHSRSMNALRLSALSARLIIIALCVAPIASVPAPAATWQELQLVCQNDASICDAYMMGVMEGLLLANAAATSTEPLEEYCIPSPGLSYQTFKAAVDELLRDQPRARTMQAGAIGHLALAREFGCE
jgi:hypothetical protein